MKQIPNRQKEHIIGRFREYVWLGWLVCITLMLVLLVVTSSMTRSLPELLESLIESEAEIRIFCGRQRELSLIGAFVLYALLSSLPLPIAAAASVVYGWIFGAILGIPLVSLASTTGATLTFLACRYSFRNWVGRRYASVLQSIDSALERDGNYYVVLLRLLPGVPFFAINATLGLTRLSTLKFIVLSLIGMLPGTIAFVYFGSQLPTLRALKDGGIQGNLNWQLNLILIAMVIASLMIRRLTRKSE